MNYNNPARKKTIGEMMKADNPKKKAKKTSGLRPRKVKRSRAKS